MLRTIILSAFGAGLAVGVLLSLVQAATTEPLILRGEVYEKAAPAEHEAHHDAAAGDETAHAAASAEPAEHHHDAGAWEPADGFERTAYTVLANVLMGVATAAMLLGAMALSGRPIEGRTGLLWGLGGFFALSLLPALGLAPELPGTAAAEITSRQAWWLGTAVASAAGLVLLVFVRSWIAKAAGIAIAIVPHVIGAPQPPTLEAAYPAALGAEFVVASLVASALLWASSGLCSGWLYRKLARDAA